MAKSRPGTYPAPLAPRFTVPWLVATAVGLLGVLVSCGGRTPDAVEPAPDVVEPAPAPEPVIDCDRIAAGYVPCLPGTPGVTPGRTVKPPQSWVALPCTFGPRIDLFTDGHRPQDILTLQEILALEKAQPGGVCLHLHAFGVEGAPAPAQHLFELLRRDPADGWNQLHRFVEEKRYLGTSELDLMGPPAPPDPELAKDLTAATAGGARFGVRQPGLFLIDHRTQPSDLGFTAARELIVTATGDPPAAGRAPDDQLVWTDAEPDPEGRVREFSLLCRTRQDWKHRLTVISDCLTTTKSCPQLRSCISARLYEQEWNESETLEVPAQKDPSLVTAGGGQVRVHAWLDPDCPHSRELFQTLHNLLQRDTRIRLHLDLVASSGKAALVRQTLLDPALAGSPAGQLCVLSQILSHYHLLDAGDIPRMAATCGIAPPVLPTDGKNLKLPAGALPAFCAPPVTPCLLVGAHLIEGVPSDVFLDFGITREARELAGSKP